MGKDSSENLKDTPSSILGEPSLQRMVKQGVANGDTPSVEVVETSSITLPSRTFAQNLPEQDSIFSNQTPSGNFSNQERLQGLSSRPLKDIIENYLSYYADGEGHTARAKRYDLQHFLEFLEIGQDSVSYVPRVSDWTLQATKNFVDERLSRGESPATVSRRLATLKHLGRTLSERVHGFINPAREAKGPSFKTTNPGCLGEEEINLLLEACQTERLNSRSFTAQRNSLLVELLLSTGLRADEVRLLTWGQVSEDFNWLKGVKTKGKKFRNVYLNTKIREALSTFKDLCLEEYQNKLKSEGFGEEKPYPVFPSFYRVKPESPKSFHLSPKSVWRIVSDMGKAANLMAESQKLSIKRLHPHKLRHTFAHGLLDSSKDIRLVAQALGHSDVRTTMRYTERSDEEIAQAIEEKINQAR